MMHTYRKRQDGTYDVVFASSHADRIAGEALIAKCSFEMAIWYVNILNGGNGKFDNKK